MIKGLQTFLKKQCHKIFCRKFFLANYCRPIWVLDSWVKSNYGLEFRIVWDLILPTQIKNNKIRTDFRPKSGIGHKKLNRNIEIEKLKMKVKNGCRKLGLENCWAHYETYVLMLSEPNKSWLVCILNIARLLPVSVWLEYEYCYVFTWLGMIWIWVLQSCCLSEND